LSENMNETAVQRNAPVGQLKIDRNVVKLIFLSLITLGIYPLVLFSGMADSSEAAESAVCGGFLLVIAVAVWCFVYGGMEEYKYKIEKYNRDNNPTEEVKARRDLLGKVCGAIMLTATAVYVALGALLDSWGRDWWIFAVGGILCAAAGLFLGEKEEDE